MPDYHPFHPEPRPPARPPPAGTIDSQFHVMGPRDRYPVRPGAGYEMPTATWEAAARMHRALGIRRGVIVQATTYGADHQVVLDALAALGPGYRACANAVVLSERDDAYVARLHAAGVRGARFTFRRELNLAPTAEGFARSIARIRELGWYAKVQPDQSGFVVNAPMFEGLDIPVVIDHMGRSSAAEGPQGPNATKVRELLGRGNFWVMLSLGEKLSQAGPPWSDVIPIARSFVEAAPDRVVWGSDWPHPLSMKPPPNDAELLELVYRILPDEEALARTLVANPARLFGFDS